MKLKYFIKKIIQTRSVARAPIISLSIYLLMYGLGIYLLMYGLGPPPSNKDMLVYKSCNMLQTGSNSF